MRSLAVAISIAFLFLGSQVFAQEVPDTLEVEELLPDSVFVFPDSLTKTQRKMLQGWPVPKKAALWAIAPGGGQIYNRRWWKLPIVYGAMGSMVYLITFNQDTYRRLRTALELERMDEDHEFTGTAIDNEQSLLSLRDQYDKNTQLSYIGLTFVYMLTAMEAYVDAHLRNFDINDDLTMELRIKPELDIQSTLGQPIIGVGVQLSFQKPKATSPRDFLLSR